MKLPSLACLVVLALAMPEWCSGTVCHLCNQKSLPQFDPETGIRPYPTLAECGQVMKNGDICKQIREKAYYKCSRAAGCGTLHVVNVRKQWDGSEISKTECRHENKYIVDQNINTPILPFPAPAPKAPPPTIQLPAAKEAPSSSGYVYHKWI
ncbi:hypothetical protein PGT21_014199 [Puccinia graminis f. sp. tritici]|uniref:Uncharacterized protein n=1 Tax=Puccinia graminis f. sp. tritici TaxID=56615 RepID=A0A5B0Q5I5_PUCGR|nr:hypothetical protein PGT21_014199 [Puccinia graminis f. sp. tritici]